METSSRFWSRTPKCKITYGPKLTSPEPISTMNLQPDLQHRASIAATRWRTSWSFFGDMPNWQLSTTSTDWTVTLRGKWSEESLSASSRNNKNDDGQSSLTSKTKFKGRGPSPHLNMQPNTIEWLTVVSWIKNQAAKCGMSIHWK